jgi:cyclophilin family peptidyl-prolyl cis-trans isomerase
MLIRTLVALVFSLSTALVWAANPPARPAGSNAATPAAPVAPPAGSNVAAPAAPSGSNVAAPAAALGSSAAAPAPSGSSAVAPAAPVAPPAGSNAAAPPAPSGSNAAAPAAGSKTAEFNAINKEFNDLVANLGALKTEYATATDSAKKAEIKKQFNEGVAKAQAIERKLAAAAAGAYAEAPNSDKKIVDLLVGTLYDLVTHDDFEPAYQLGKTLMDNKCDEIHVPSLAGVAAFCVDEFDQAGVWLHAAKAQGNLPQEYQHYLDSVEYYKDAWAKEKIVRDAEAKADNLPRVLLKTSAGDIELELFENEAPNTVLNFITLVEKGFYNGLKFHRVLPDFMAQGGDPKGDGSGGPGYTIPCECYEANHRLHFRGSLSMAHRTERDTGGSQFFINFVPTRNLDGKHTVFGRVISGFDVLAKLKRRDPDGTTVGAADTIIEAKVIRKRPHPYDAKDVKKSGNSD